MDVAPHIPGVDPYVQTAVHEMGHALVVSKSRAQLISVEIWEDRGYVVGMVVSEVPETASGVGVKVARASWFTPSTWVSPEDLYDSCVSCVAGQYAECMWLEREFAIPMDEALEITKDAAWFDLKNFRERSELLRPYMPDISIRGCRAEAAHYLRGRWGDVERLSKKLANRYSLRPATVAS